jgi:metal-responsive CopG/Arc/MetJ family transcriptional regulator
VKVAISLPDPLFKAAERLAKELKKPRSQLYAEAISEYLGNHENSMITEKLNAVYSKEASSVDEALHRAQLETLSDETW